MIRTLTSTHRTQDFKSPFDATVVHQLTASGATIIGKTNCDEFGMGYATLLDTFPIWRLTYTYYLRFEGL
jgi:Asp-tRNA(Asn)/Glu-tRNA(Gln) amidotransferase A subunit family amidase